MRLPKWQPAPPAKENDCMALQFAALQRREHSILFRRGCCSALVSSPNSIVTCAGVQGIYRAESAILAMLLRVLCM